MKLRSLLVTPLCLLAAGLFANAQAQISFQGKEGPGKGKKIVLLAGDEEYRSEELLPMLAKILSERHGFDTTVVFSINPTTGEVDPNTKDNNPGLEVLKKADLCIMLLRFRAWPDDQMKHFADYAASGKPIIGLRTSTHAFNGLKGEYAAYNTFGKRILGEQWVSHWGKHKSEATKGVIEPGQEGNALLRGVTNIFGDTDVYEAYPPADANILVRGQVLAGMTPESAPADYAKKRSSDKAEQGVNAPMMPVVWTREVLNPSGKTSKIVTTTMGSSSDFKNEDLRRLIINGAYWTTGLEVPAKADVNFVGEFKGSFYGFNGFVKGLKPEDLAK
ncbi:MAG: ThuA domain-containing protein [Verrucomicrobium sp.]